MIREFRLEGWRVQPQFHQLVGPGGAVEVEAHSMEVLVALAKQAGEVVSRQELLEEVWGESIVEEAALTHAIWDLRKALGDDPKKPEYIQTLPKRGYRLIAKVGWLDRGVGETERYRLLRRIGGGGMGVVFEAEDTRLRRHVALKFLPPEWSRDSLARDRFIREARAAAALEHPNLCNLHEIDETEDGRLFLVMALYEGETLKERLARGRPTPAEVLEIAEQVARGLAALHRIGIVHRDIKPGNIMLPSNGPARILDFGLAKFAGGTQLTKTSTSPGTPAYMSPEQVRGEEVDARTDIWSLGAVLYEMLTGRPPFGRGARDALMYSILEREPPPLRMAAEAATKDLEAIVSRALAKRPQDRYPSAGELLQALLGALDAGGGVGPLAETPTEAVADQVEEQWSEAPGGSEGSLPGHGLVKPEAVNLSAGLSGARRTVVRWVLIAGAATAVLVLSFQSFRHTLESKPAGGMGADSATQSSQARSFFERAESYAAEGFSRPKLRWAEQMYRDALALEPDTARYQAHLAHLLSRIHSRWPGDVRVDEIEKLVESALAADAKLLAAWLARATLLLNQAKGIEAESAARKAMEVAPLDYRGHSLLGRALVAQGREDEGLEQLRESVDVGSGYYGARETLALELFHLGRYEDALVEYRKVLEFAPDSESALNNTSAAMLSLGLFADAIPILNRILKFTPDDDLVLNNLGTAYYYEGRLDKAIESFQAAVAQAPHKPEHSHYMAEVWAQLGASDTARSWFAKAVEQYDRSLEAGGPEAQLLAARAVCAWKLGREDEALANTGRSLELAPESVWSTFYAAQVYALSGKRKLMFEYVRKSIVSGLSRRWFRLEPAFEPYQADPVMQRILDYEVDPA